MRRLNRINKIALITLGSLLIVGIGLWVACPALTFGGRYHHHDSGSVYEFRDGRFYENGNDLGRYTVHLRTVKIYLDIEHVDEPIHAKLGWQTIYVYGGEKVWRLAGSGWR
jgi:hypothetical protein